MTSNKIILELSSTELAVLGLLAGIGLSAFEAPAGPAYVIKYRLEEQMKKKITTDDIKMVMEKLQKARNLNV